MTSGGGERRAVACGLAWWMANLPVCAVLAVFARVREIPRFWRTEGGYAGWQREMVLLGFPLVLGFELIFLWGVSVVLMRARARGRPSPGWMIGLWVLQVVWVLGVLGFQGWDNVENLLAGRPLHWGGR